MSLGEWTMEKCIFPRSIDDLIKHLKSCQYIYSEMTQKDAAFRQYYTQPCVFERSDYAFVQSRYTLHAYWIWFSFKFLIIYYIRCNHWIILGLASYFQVFVYRCIMHSSMISNNKKIHLEIAFSSWKLFLN